MCSYVEMSETEFSVGTSSVATGQVFYHYCFLCRGCITYQQQGKSLSVREEEEEREREQYLKGSVQLVHLSELVSFGEIELGSHCQITGILLQGPVQSIQGLAQTHTVNTHCQHKLKHTHRWTSTHREQLSSQSWVLE